DKPIKKKPPALDPSSWLSRCLYVANGHAVSLGDILSKLDTKKEGERYHLDIKREATVVKYALMYHLLRIFNSLSKEEPLPDEMKQIETFIRKEDCMRLSNDLCSYFPFISLESIIKLAENINQSIPKNIAALLGKKIKGDLPPLVSLDHVSLFEPRYR